MSEHEPELPRVLRLMWAHDQPARRGPKPALTISDIAGAGVRVADTDGLAAVSMSRVAGELGYTTMSLYRYLDTKNDLFLAMTDHAYGRPALPAPSLGWRDQLGFWADAARAVLLRHPWLSQIPISEPPLGPNQLSWMEAGLQALGATQLSQQEKLSCMLLVDVYVRGQTKLGTDMSPHLSHASQEPVGPGTYSARLGQLIEADTFPGVWGAMISGALQDEDTDFASEEFRFGLTTVLNGIEALVSRRARRPRRRRPDRSVP